jgi:hypothetical protein
MRLDADEQVIAVAAGYLEVGSWAGSNQIWKEG